MTGQTSEIGVRLIKPCKHMVDAVNGLSDGTLKGPMKVYTRLHVLHCTHCRTALKSLSVLHNRLGTLAEPVTEAGVPEMTMAALEAALERVETTRGRAER